MKWFLCGFDFSPNRVFLFSEAFLLSTNAAFFVLDLSVFCSKYTDYRLVTEHFTFFCVMGEDRTRLFRGEVCVGDSRHIVGKVAPLSFQSRDGT